jgi:hypothetical protein
MTKLCRYRSVGSLLNDAQSVHACTDCASFNKEIGCSKTGCKGAQSTIEAPHAVVMSLCASENHQGQTKSRLQLLPAHFEYRPSLTFSLPWPQIVSRSATSDFIVIECNSLTSPQEQPPSTHTGVQLCHHVHGDTYVWN